MSETNASILFVDNDGQTLTKLEQLLATEPWDCHFIDDAQAALNFIASSPFDLIVSNAELNGMGGIALLDKVRQTHPGMIRLFFAKNKQAVNTLASSCAQQVIPQPWFNQELKEIIRSALRQRTQQKKHSLQFQTLINSMPLLPALPESYLQVQSCVMEDDVDIEKMAAIISQDVALSCAMLHWANSALFGQRFRVDTIKKAILVLGTDIVSNLVLSESVAQSMAGTEPTIEGFNLKRFKNHSIAVATLARLLSATLNPTDSDIQDRAFIAGLLHDMGKLLESKHCSQKFTAATQLAQQQNWPLHEAERKLFGATHAELGSFLAEWWSLPHFIIAAIRYHQEPQDSPIDPQIINAVYLANQLSYHFGFGCNGEKIERQVDQELWKKFLLSEEGLEILQVKTEEIVTVLGS